MNRFLILLTFVFICFGFSQKTFAVPAYPYPVTIKQPDGTSLRVILKGDEFHHYYTTADGFLIVKNEQGVYNYAKQDSYGNQVDTRIKAHNESARSNKEKTFLNTISKEINFSMKNQQMRAKRASAAGSNVPPPARFPKTGSPRSLVILVNFSDLAFVTPTPNAAFDDMLNKLNYSENGGTGSARDYFRDNTMGAFTPHFDVVGPYTLPNNFNFYGKNDAGGNDDKAIQMIVDACKVAFDNGIDFSQYDTDGDNIVDNVFVYYAGHNEAEQAGTDRIWPHRWGVYPTEIFGGGNYSGTAASVTFNGKRVEDYACTSELKGNSGSSMAGIGTFTHEFGHVLGLADMYATNNASHFTLSDWNIMDGGSYLNAGRTPPSYNAFERFQLGYLTPLMLTTPIDVILNPLNVSNQAYLISSTDSHNLNPSNPSPTEFFLLENRQKTGWDKYLPGHGMLVYRINYNQSDWDYNRPNNDPARMGVDLMEADGIASKGTMSGDPFPGTANVQSYTPTLRNGNSLSSKELTYIKENSGVIRFKFNRGSNAPILNVSNVFTAFHSTVGVPSAHQTTTISGQKLESDIHLSFESNEHFEMKKESDPETAWGNQITLQQTDSIVPNTNIQVRYKPFTTSGFLTHMDKLFVQTDVADKRTISLIGNSPAPPLATDATNITYQSFNANWSIVKGAMGYLLTVIRENLDGTQTILSDYNEKWIGTNSATVTGLVSDRNHLYKVKAAKYNRVSSPEDTTGYSNTVSVRTLQYPFKKELRVAPIKNSGSQQGAVNVFVPEEEIGTGKILVFDVLGHKVREADAHSEIVTINDLPKNMVFIIVSGKQRAKVLLVN